MNYDAMKKIVDEEVTFFTDEQNDTDVYVEYERHNGARCFESIKSEHFESFLSYRYRQLNEDDELPDFKDHIKRKKADAIYLQDHRVPIYRRIAGSLPNNSITYFLADDKWNYVKITPKGYQTVATSEHKFLKTAMDAPQVKPLKGGNYLDLILPKINMAPDDRLLYAVYLVHGFSRTSSHFAAIISSEKGTGKSTLTKQSTELLSPNVAGVTIAPSSEDDLKTQLANNYLVSFDNAAPLSTTYSNILCAAITGAKDAKRKLYTNADQVVLNLHNLVLINGINIVPYQSDLKQRSLYFQLLPIAGNKRRTDAEIWAEFNRDRPYILGAIFRTLSKAMRILPTVKVENRHRMADAHVEMMAIALALDIKQEEFQRILDANLEKLEEAYSANNPLVELVLGYMRSRGTVDMAATSLYQELEKAVVGDKGFFPKSASHLSRRLNEEKETLSKNGFNFEKYKKTDNNYIKISRIQQNQMTVEQKKRAEARRNSLLDDASMDD